MGRLLEQDACFYVVKYVDQDAAGRTVVVPYVPGTIWDRTVGVAEAELT